MKSKLSNNCCGKGKPFPKLMYLAKTSDASIALMSDKCTGVVVHVGSASSNILGEYRDDWNERCMRDYEGDVCLTND